MEKVKRPLNRNIIIVCSVFVGLLCIISSFLLYQVYTRNMTKRYKTQLNSIVSYVESMIDHDDMAKCAETFEESDKYKEFQVFFDNLIDYYDDVHYLYIMKVGDVNDEVPIYEICAANSTYEKTFEPDMVLHLGDGEADWFSLKQVKQYRKILDSKKDSYFRNESTWGVDYTLARPVCDSNGNYYGLLCADIAIDEINSVIYRNIFINIAIIAAVGVLFIVLLVLWMRKNVTIPLKKLETSVTEFASNSSGVRNPDDLLYVVPKINTKNEVESLATAYDKLAQDMRDYIVGIGKAENEAQDLKTHVSEMNAIAYKDALTHVKNKAAYEEKRDLLIRDIRDAKAEFGIVMADINSLKVINDKYGHEKGDEYIIGACMLISTIYKHSPVYRIGGDEFVVVIQTSDYEDREELLEKAKEAFERTANDTSKDPWNRYSAAVGMSIWSPGDDFDTVFRRADKAMYDEKSRIKAHLKIE